jgi:isochorismate synthase
MTSDDFFEQIQNHYKNELPFVAYRKPNESILKCLLQKDSIVHDVSDFTESGFVLAPFDNKDKPVLIPIDSAELLKCDTVQSNGLTTQETGLGETHLKNPIASEKQKQFHIQLVERAVNAIQRNDYLKVVLSRKEEISLEESSPIDIFKKLLNTYQSAFVYCWYHPKVGLWLGATPETLLNIQGNRLSTMALAGTQNFRGTLDVIWQKKEKEEQQIVTDFIVKSLQSSVSSLQFSDRETIKAGNLLHLKTTITANLNLQSSNLKELLKKLHPTPAICGIPKEKAKQFILANEGYHREYYSGFLGELNFKERTSRNSNKRNVENNAYATIKATSNLYVNLRCMQLKDNIAIIYVGGGITKDSVPEMEWEETVSKAEVIKSVL